MHLNFVGFAIPFFIGVILLEFFVARKRGLKYFNLHSSIANISIGVAERLADVFVAGLFYFVYDSIQKSYGNFHFAIELWLAAKNKSGFINKIRIIFGRPSMIDPSLREEAETIFNIYQNPTPIERPLNRYVLWQMIILLVCLSGFILFEDYLGISIKIGFAFITILTLINCGAIMEQKQWIFLVEFLRLSVIMMFLFCSFAFWQWKLFWIVSLLSILLFYYRPIKKNYLAYVYR